MEDLVENVILPDGMRRLRIIGDAPISPLQWLNALPDEALSLAVIAQGEDKALGIHTLTLTWPARDVILETKERGEIFKTPLVMWKLIEGDRVSMAIRFAADLFERAMGRRPGFAWLRSLPKGVEEGVDVGDVRLLLADWAYPGCVFIGG